MCRAFAIAAAVLLLCLASVAQADVFNLGPGLTNLETVAVRDPGNTADTWFDASVDYNYNIGKYEVTAKQYTDFLNAKAKTDTFGLYSTYMADTSLASRGCNIQRSGTSGNYSYSLASDWANRPVNYVNFWDACRFANWLGNGQGEGDTETGAYTLNGYSGQDGRTINRNAVATWAVASEAEWYKAAYYKGGGTNAGYWDYPMQSDYPMTPGNTVVNPDPGNSANYRMNMNYSIGGPYYRTNVGEFENSASAYGTYDQGGNVWEWNDTITYETSERVYRGCRGSSFYYSDSSMLQATYRSGRITSIDGYDVGFRVSEVVPEPASIIALAAGLVSLLGIRRRRA